MLNREAILSGQNTFYEQLRLSLQDLYTVALFAVSKRWRKFFSVNMISWGCIINRDYF